jgi:hypothetical protein
MTADAMISVLSNATRIACGDMTSQHLNALHASVDQASCLPARPDWGRKAAAHAQIFDVLADMAADPATRALLSNGSGFVFDLLIAAGRAADGMAANSRERFLSRLQVAEWEGAALEMERHLRALHFMWRLADSAPR